MDFWSVSTKGNSNKEKDGVKADRHIRMAASMKECTKMASSMDKAPIYGLISQNTWVTGKTMRSMGLANTGGTTGESTKANGWKTSSMELVHTHGPTAGFTKANSSRTKSRGMAFTPGKTAKNTMDSGKVASSMVKAGCQMLRERRDSENGRMARESPGLIMKA